VSHVHPPSDGRGNPLGMSSIGYCEFQAIMRKLVDYRFWSREKIPTARLCLQSLRVVAQNLRSVFVRIDTERNQMHVSFLQRLLQFAHSAADHRARPRTGCVNESGDPDLAS